MKTIRLGSNKKFNYPVGRSPDILKHNCSLAAKSIDDYLKVNGITSPVIVCRGSSGAMIASCITMFMNTVVPIVHLKKSGETSHSHNGDIMLDDYNFVIVVDDFVCTGTTLQAILDHVKIIDLLVLSQGTFNDEFVVDCYMEYIKTFINIF